MTPVRIGKTVIATVPHVMDAIDAWSSGGPRGVAVDINKKFTGIDMDNHSFNFWDLVRGYAPAAGAWGFGKVYGRVLR